MHIKSVTINNYKSIKTPQTIDFNSDLITLIGKNGSGKTNVLEAIKNLFSNHRYSSNTPLTANMSIEISDDDMNSYFGVIKIDKEKKEAIIYYIHERGLCYIKCEMPILSFKTYRNQLESILNDIEISSQELIVQLNIIQEDPLFQKNSPIHNLISFEKDRSEIEWKINSIIHDVEYAKNMADAYIEDNFDEDRYLIDNSEQNKIQFDCIDYIDDLKLKYRSPPTCDLIDKYIKIEHSELHKLINDINKRLKDARKEFERHIHKFNYVIKNINKVVRLKERRNNDIENKKKSFIKSATEACKRKIYYLENESSIIFKQDDYGQRDYNSINPVADVLYKKCVEKELIEIDDNDKNNNDKIKEQIEKLEDKTALLNSLKEFVNSKIPSFDKEMFKEVDIKFDNGFSLILIESTGDKTPFESTSLGRRWYFTYLFIKSLLDKDDIFLIDEPASFLHPQAQEEVLQELEELSNQGKKVIISTHSPYMISSSTKNEIYQINIAEEVGTEIVNIKLDGIAKHKNEIGLTAYNEMLLGLAKKQILVEGPSDIVCLKTMMKILQIKHSDYNIKHISGAYNIDTLVNFLDNNNTSFLILLDSDTKEWENNEDENKKRIGKFVKNYNKQNLYFSGEECEKKCIEGLFVDDDYKNHTELVMYRGKKVKLEFEESIKTHGMNDSTKNNFTKLFKKMEML